MNKINNSALEIEKNTFTISKNMNEGMNKIEVFVSKIQNNVKVINSIVNDFNHINEFSTGNLENVNLVRISVNELNEIVKKLDEEVNSFKID